MVSINWSGQSITPGKIICVGQNYMAHIHELNNKPTEEMVLFLKPGSAISETVRAFHDHTQLHHEAEISFLYQDNGFKAIGLGLDLTKRELQYALRKEGLPWEKCKAFNGSAVFSEFVNLDQISGDIKVQLKKNGQVIQSAQISEMIYSPDKFLQEITKHFDLQDGDIVMSGSPSGAGPLNQGDRLLGSIFVGDQEIINQEWQVK